MRNYILANAENRTIRKNALANGDRPLGRKADPVTLRAVKGIGFFDAPAILTLYPVTFFTTRPSAGSTTCSFAFFLARSLLLRASVYRLFRSRRAEENFAFSGGPE